MGPAEAQRLQMLGKAQDAGLLPLRPVPVVEGLHRPHHVRLRPLHQRHRPLRGVMPVPHARGQGFFIRPQRAQDAARQEHFLSQRRLQHFLRHPAGAKDGGPPMAKVDHRGFQPHLAAAPIQNQRDPALHILQHMGRGGRRGPAGTVGAGRRDGQPAGLQHLPRAGHGWHPDRHRRQSRRYLVRNPVRFGEKDRQRPGPEGVHQLLRPFRKGAEPLQLGRVMDVHDQRIVRRAALGGKNRQHGLWIQGVGPQSVNRLRRKSDQLPLGEKPGGQSNRGPVGRRKNLCLHGILLAGGCIPLRPLL